MDDNQRSQISARAYELWEAAGRPDGQADSFWYQALNETQEDIADANSVGRVPEALNDPVTSTARKKRGVID